MFEVGVAGSFDALHRLQGEDESAAQEHSHDYRVEVVVRGEVLSADGMLLDLDDLNAALSACLKDLDSADLDQLQAFSGSNTTVEMVAGHIWDHVRDRLPSRHGLAALRVTLYESPDAWASIDRPLEG